MHTFIKTVGAGQKRARDLTWQESRDAMTALLEAQPAQVGAFLLAMRMKGERADELGGLASVVQERTPRMPAPMGTLTVDAHGDGHAGVLSLLPAAACAAAACGTPVWLDVDLASPFARHGLAGGLAAIGCDGALDPGRGLRAIGRRGIATCDLAYASPALAHLVGLRAQLGVRTLAQSIAKLVSPSVARRRIVAVFHGPYLEPIASALWSCGGVERGLVVQALGGLPEARPGKVLRVAYPAGAATTLDLRALADDDPPPPPPTCEETDPAALDAASARANRGALDGDPRLAPLAAATAGVFLHAATGEDPVAAARSALAALVSGRARAVAD